MSTLVYTGSEASALLLTGWITYTLTFGSKLPASPSPPKDLLCIADSVPE